WFIILLILIISLQKIVYYKAESLKRISYNEYDSVGRNIEKLGNIGLGFNRILPEEEEKSYRLLIDTGVKIRNAAKKKDYTECTRLISLTCLIRGKSSAKTEGLLKQKSFESKAREVWKNVSGGMEYDEVTFEYGNMAALKDYCDSDLIVAKYYHDLYKRNLISVDRYHI